MFALRGTFRAAIFAAVCVPMTAHRAAAADLRIDFKELASIASLFLSDAKIRLHNAQTGMFDFTSGSSITLSGAQVPLPFPVRSFETLGVKFAYLVNDLNSSAIKISPADGAVRISIAFESEGPELQGRCLSELCSTNAILPEIEWDDAGLTMDLVPVKTEQGLSLKAQRVEVLGRITPLCRGNGFFSRNICEAALPKARSTLAKLKGDLDKGLVAQVNSETVQEKIAGALKGYLKLGKAGDVTVSKVSVENGGRAVVLSFCLSC